MLRRATPERLSTFSDGVFAVLITVLMSELRPLESPTRVDRLTTTDLQCEPAPARPLKRFLDFGKFLVEGRVGHLLVAQPGAPRALLQDQVGQVWLRWARA